MRRGLQVISGSSVIHSFMDDGEVVFGNSVNGFTLGISGSAELGRRTNNIADVTKINGSFRIPRYSGATESDVAILNTLAASPTTYNGYIIYLNSAGLTAGATVGSTTISAAAGTYFAIGHRWYFCRDGQWDADRFA
ncbi:MAG: hypothetical protein CL402_07995 [Acidiferrobacteraceae bacterium]|nr:hypothetical protein [Acidiferrobacteraceae bacterium]